MPRRPDSPPLTRGVVLRALGFGIAVVLGAVAIWMVATGTDQKGIKIGFLAGLWGVLLGAYSVFGSRRPGEEHNRSDVPVLTSTDIELRASGEVERIAEAAVRRAFEERLEAMIRRELNATMHREVSDLRAEITRLRQDLLDKVGGQLRLERIETTRLIGSDLEALQHEVRQLKAANESGTSGGFSLTGHALRQIVEPAARESADASAPAAAEKAAREKAAAEKAERERALVEKAAREKAAATEVARERAATESAAREKAAAEKAAAERAASARAERERAAADKAARERAAAERAERERAAAQRAARERALAEKAARERALADEAARERAAREKAARDKAAREKAAADQAAADKAAREKAAAEKAAGDKAAREKAAAEKTAAEKVPAGAGTWTPPPPREPSLPAAPAASSETTGPIAPVRPDATPQPVAARSDDPFADLPRITPFTDFELDPIESAPPVRANGHPDSYVGRRRAGDGTMGSAHAAREEAENTGRHSQPGAPAASEGGRRRRNEDAATGDVLKRVLTRDSADH